MKSEKEIFEKAYLQFWSGRTSAGHRSSEEDFLLKEAKEKLLHLDGGVSLLDFGCGSADLLYYFISHYDYVVGVDFSSSMLNEAKKRIAGINHNSVLLLLADDKTVWNKLNSNFDRITAGQVVQNFTIQQIDNFILMASRHLNEGGRIVLFDIIDPKLYFLWKLGFFKKDFKSHCVGQFVSEIHSKISSIIKRHPDDIIHLGYSPHVIEAIALKYHREVEYVKSIYYEYRYHLIIK